MSDSFALTQGMFDWAWTTSVQATLLITLALLLQMLLRKWLTPGMRYAFGILILIRLLLPMPFPAPFGLTTQLPIPVERSFGTTPPPASNTTLGTLATHAETGAVVAVRPGGVTLHGVISLVWLTGFFGLMMIAITRHSRWSQAIRQARPITDPNLLSLLEEARHTMRVNRPIHLLAVDGLASPSVFGVWNVRLLLPEGVWDRLNREELRMVFLHELAHVRSHDPLLNWVLIAAQFLHWFNPLVWLAMHRLRADRELVCDATVMRHLALREHSAYAGTLLKLMEDMTSARRSPSGAIPVIHSQHEIKRRILMIKHPRKPGMTARIGSILLVLSLCAVTFTRAAEREPDTGPLSNRDSPARRTPAGDGLLLAQNKTTPPEETSADRAAQAGEPAPLPFFQIRLVLDEPTADSEELIQVIPETLDGRGSQQSPERVRESVRTVHAHRQPLLDHTAFRSARGLVDQGLPEASLEIVLTAEGAGKFAEATREHLGEKVAFILDGKVHSVPRIAGEIHGGVIRLNEPTLEKAKALADKLNAAASEIDAKP